MKTTHVFLLLILLLATPQKPVWARGEKSTSGATHFKWFPGSEESGKLMIPEGGFRIQQGNYTITGPPQLYVFGRELIRFLIDSEQEMAEQYGLKPGRRLFEIPLIPIEDLRQGDQQLTLFSDDPNRMIFPFPADPGLSLDSRTSRLNRFNLLHALIRASLAYGSEERLPISSHAFRFIDGLSGHLALNMVSHGNPDQAASILDILDRKHARDEATRRFSAAQLLEQNANSEDTDIMAGLNQFFSGIGLTRNSEGAINPADGSSTADRIRLFEWVSRHKGRDAIGDIIGYLSRSSGVWAIEENTEDSFCREFIHYGCRERTIDGTRSDIILQYVTGMNYAQLLRLSKKDSKPDSSGPIPHFPIYGFDYPKAGGANENVVGIHLKHDSMTIDAGDILDSETVATNGVSLELGIRDEAYRIQIQIEYSTGQKEQDERLLINNLQQSVPQTISTADLLIGSRILKNGHHSGWSDEIGVYFHWKRLQVEWDTRNVSGATADREYINSGFFLLDVQNRKAWMVSRNLAVGLNYDFQLGLVNQSGSTRVIRSEKYNSDTSNPVLGINLGPELNINLPALKLNLRFGGTADYLWQPLDDKGGKSGGGNNTINASQYRTHLYATVGLVF